MDNQDHEILEYMLTTDEVISEYKEANATVTAENDRLRKENERLSTLQKQASVSSPEFPVEKVSTTIDKCVEAGFIQRNEKEAHVELVHKDPLKALELLNKLAAGTIEASTVRQTGTMVEKTASTRPSSGKTLNESKSDSDLFFEQKFQV